MPLGLEQVERGVRRCIRDRYLLVDDEGAWFAGSEGQKAGRPGDREMRGDDVPVCVIAQLEDEGASARHESDQTARQYRIVTGYEQSINAS